MSIRNGYFYHPLTSPGAINRQNSSLVVVNINDAVSVAHSLVSCMEIDAFAPFISVLKDIVLKSNYNGFAVANLKCVGNIAPEFEIEKLLARVKDISPGTEVRKHGNLTILVV